MSKKVDAAVSASNLPSLCITELYYPDFFLCLALVRGLGGLRDSKGSFAIISKLRRLSHVPFSLPTGFAVH